MDYSGYGSFIFRGKLYYTLVTKLTDYNMAPTKCWGFLCNKNNGFIALKN